MILINHTLDKHWKYKGEHWKYKHWKYKGKHWKYKYWKYKKTKKALFPVYHKYKTKFPVYHKEEDFIASLQTSSFITYLQSKHGGVLRNPYFRMHVSLDICLIVMKMEIMKKTIRNQEARVCRSNSHGASTVLRKFGVHRSTQYSSYANGGLLMVQYCAKRGLLLVTAITVLISKISQPANILSYEIVVKLIKWSVYENTAHMVIYQSSTIRTSVARNRRSGNYTHSYNNRVRRITHAQYIQSITHAKYRGLLMLREHREKIIPHTRIVEGKVLEKLLHMSDWV